MSVKKLKLNELSASRQLQYVSMYTDMSNNLYNVGCNLCIYLVSLLYKTFTKKINSLELSTNENK